MNVLIIDPDEGRAALVAEGIRADHSADAMVRIWPRFELRMLRDFDPDMVIIACESPDRAKGVLMKSRNLSEDDAYRALRKHAMDTGRPIQAVAAD
ncbi:MAG: ANTAR domain-containing protein, partial [Asticcacaulis sp.]